jgi:hypothetical protein
MDYSIEILDAHQDPERLETLFQIARQEDALKTFAASLEACYREAGDNLLYAAWHYRLEAMAQEEQSGQRGINWKVALPVSIAAGLVLWLSSDPAIQVIDGRQLLSLYMIPIGMLFALAYLALADSGIRRRIAFAAVALVAACAYAPLVVSARDAFYQNHFANLMTLHLPLLGWAALGAGVLGLNAPRGDRFAFLLKSLEIFITAGIFLIGGGVFVGVTQGLFFALDIHLSDTVMRLLGFGVMGTLALLALAFVYDPTLRPTAQDFKTGLGRLVTTLMRLLLAPTLIVLAIYILAIFTNFEEPFKNRDILGIYHAMLFAVLALLIGATPMQESDLPVRFRSMLRYGLVAVAGLAMLVGLYTLAAIVYRTTQDVLTMNRLALMGWDVINVGILAMLINGQVNLGRRGQGWVEAMQSAFSLGAVGYVAWTTFVVVVVPIVIR